MDPVATLKAARQALRDYRSAEKLENVGEMLLAAESAAELADDFEALDKWMSRGGFSPWHASQPYNYRGHLKPYLPFILERLRAGDECSTIAENIRQKMRDVIDAARPDDNSYCKYFSVSCTSTEIRYICKRHNIPVPGPVHQNESTTARYAFRREVMKLYFCDGKTYQEIADIHTLSNSRIGQIINQELDRARKVGCNV
jgi:hypothetical protein